MKETEPGNRMKPSRKRSCILLAIAGAVVLGVIVPCGLAAMRMTDLTFDGGDTGPSSLLAYIERAAMLCMIAGFFCSPGAVILSAIIVIMLRKQIHNEGGTHARWIQRGSVYGAVAAFLNFPGYLAAAILPDDGFMPVRLITLFAVTGATCGAWLGWQAWRENDLEAGLVPRFSLRMLIFLVLGWGVLLSLFVPRPA